MMNTRIHRCFEQGPAFVAYLTAGDGGLARTRAAALALIRGGVTLLEIGIPFSDPIADGPVIQRAAARALEGGTTLAGILELVRELRQDVEIPIILFSYLNPILQALPSRFLREASLAGVDGLLVVDCPLEESAGLKQACEAEGLALIEVLSPSTPRERIQKIAEQGQGFLYYACRKGTTGVRQGLPEDFSEKIREIKSLTTLPVVVGFGISESGAAAQILAEAEGFVVGSFFVKALEEGKAPEELTELARKIMPKGGAS